MESTAPTGLFHEFPRTSLYLKAPRADMSLHDHKDVRVRSHRKSRKHQRLLRKASLQKRGLLDQNKSRGLSCSLCDESSVSSCAQENDQSTRLEESKASFGATLSSPACDYDSGLSVASSCPSSRASSPVSWQKPGNCVAIDCEMVGTGPGKKISELARCSVVNYRGEVIYDKYVKPELPVTDYRTRWSGITKQHLHKAISFKTAQKEILTLLRGKMVIGHAIHNDFRALKFFHPFEQTRDTSKMPLLNHIAGFPQQQKVSLQKLAFNILQKEIQVSKMGHSSVEDAQTCMELYKLVEDQVEQNLLSSSQMSDCINLDEDSTAENHYMDDQYWPSDLDEDGK